MCGLLGDDALSYFLCPLTRDTNSRNILSHCPHIEFSSYTNNLVRGRVSGQNMLMTTSFASETLAKLKWQNSAFAFWAEWSEALETSQHTVGQLC